MSTLIPRPRDYETYGRKLVIVNKELKKYARERGIKITQTDKIFRKAYEPKQTGVTFNMFIFNITPL